MAKTRDLTQGGIFGSIILMALPIMATSLIQMAYSMTDMIWIGKLGSSSVAAVGTAGFFSWLGFALILIPKVGAEIGVAQSIGKKNYNDAESYARNALQLIVIAAAVYSVVIFLLRYKLIAFFNLNDVGVEKSAVQYLSIVSLGSIFMFINPVFSGIYNGSGDSKTPFYINSIGLVINIILDPILIFGWGPAPVMGVRGAAIATVFSQFVVAMVFLYSMKTELSPIKNLHFFRKPVGEFVKKLTKFGFPVAIQSGLFTIFAIIIARIIAKWGPTPIAVQKVGSQIEAISWMTASGFGSAVSAFVGQNYGAKKWDRIYKGYMNSLAAMGVFGLAASALLIFAAKPIFMIFIQEEEAVRLGVVYLQILGFSQLFMCLEIMTSGAFNGLGKTMPPSITSIIFTSLRIPGALILSSAALLGLNGVWWSISMSSVFKGTILVIWFLILLHKHPEIDTSRMLQSSVLRWNKKYLRDKKGINSRGM